MTDQPIYIKFSDSRKPKFNLRTEFRKEGKELYAYKIAADKKGKQFIKEINNTYITLSKLDLPFLINKAELVDEDTIKFNYIDGETLLKDLEKATKLDSLEKFIKEIENFDKNILKKLPNKKKILNEQFQKIFGNFDKKEKYDIVTPGILDLNFDNFIKDKNGELYLIDYEWTFNFGIPRRYLLYRIIYNSLLQLKHILREEITLEKIEKYFNFSPTEIRRYLTWEQSFQRYVINKNILISSPVDNRLFLIENKRATKDVIVKNEEYQELIDINTKNRDAEDLSVTNTSLENLTYTIHRLCRDEETIEKLKQHEELDNSPLTKYVTGVDLYRFINDILENCNDDYALLCHEDVILPRDIDIKLKECVNTSNHFLGEDNWGLIGNAGVEVITKNVLLYLQDPNIHTISPATKKPQIVESLDGNTMLLNLKNLRKKSVKLPSNLSGYHLYDLVLCLEAHKNGLVSAVSSLLFVRHLSGGSRPHFHQASQTELFQNYFKNNYKNDIVTSINGNIVIDRENQKPKKYIEEIIEKNIHDIFDKNSYNLYLVINHTAGSKKISRLLNSIQKLQKKLNPNIVLHVIIRANIESNNLLTTLIDNKYRDLDVNIIYDQNSFKDYLHQLPDSKNSFIAALNDNEIISSEFPTNLGYILSSSNIIIGDTTIFKEEKEDKNPNPFKAVGRLESVDINSIYSGKKLSVYFSVIYNLKLFKHVLEEETQPSNYCGDSSFLFLCLKYESYKCYPASLFGIPYENCLEKTKHFYLDTTLMSKLVNDGLIPENFYKFHKSEINRLQTIFDLRICEFDSFKKGLIWRLLQKYRRVKKFIFRK